MKTDKGEGKGSLKERGVEESTVKREHCPQRKRIKTHVFVSLSTVDVNQKNKRQRRSIPAPRVKTIYSF